MRSNYKKIGLYVQQANQRNKDMLVTNLRGININKEFMPSVANTNGVDLSKYKIVSKHQFAFNPMHVGRDEMLPISMLNSDEPVIVSPAYTVFEIKNHEELDPEYLMMWCRRPEFDRNTWFTTDSSVRGGFSWADFCDMELPVPSIEKQREIVAEYNTIVNRIQLNEDMNQKLEETAQAIYKHWFVDFEFPISAEYATSIGKPELEGKLYKSSGGEMVFCNELDQEIPKGWCLDDLGKYSRVKSGYAFKSSWWESEGVPVIKIGSIQNNSIAISDVAFISDEHAMSASKYHATEGDMVIAMTGATIGKVAIIPELANYVCINQRVGIFDLGEKPIGKVPYLFFTLLRDDVQDEIMNVGGDSAQANISNTQIENIKIISATEVELCAFNKLCESFINKVLRNKKENASLLKLKDMLMARIAITEKEAQAA